MPRILDDSDFTFKPTDHIRTLIHPATGEIIIDPDAYYITSGESLMKTKQLKLDIKELIPYVLHQPPTPELATFAGHVHSAIIEVDALLAFLTERRGPYTLLECFKEEGCVRCRGTDPRGFSKPRPTTSAREVVYHLEPHQQQRDITGRFGMSEAREIRKLFAEGHNSNQLARQYKLNRYAIMRIIRGETCKELTPA